MTLKERKDINKNDKWNIEAMYASDSDWESDLRSAIQLSKDFTCYHGRLHESGKTLAEALKKNDEISMMLERVFVYSRQKLDEDNRNSDRQQKRNQAVAAISEISSATSFLMPEIISIPEDKLLQFIDEEPELKVYTHILKDAIRQKKHVLSEDKEKMLAQLSEVFSAPDNIFSMMNDADMTFGEITDEDGNKQTLTHGNFIKYMRSNDRSVREEAYNTCYKEYKHWINTISANYSAEVKTNVITSRLREYSSARARALSSGNISEAVYDNLIQEVHNAFPALHKYEECRKEVLGLDELKMFDIYVPLVKNMEDEKITFDQAVEIAKEGLAPLGDKYINDFVNGINSRWIDRYENEGKTSGAYSFGSYDSMPYILLNYDETLQDVFTLVHEMGHSLNSLYTRSTQPYVYGGHSIFTAEVASTVNETLLMRHLLKKSEEAGDKTKRLYLLNMYIEAFRTTLFRQTMFAEFEHLVHKHVEDGGSLDSQWLSETYNKLNKDYYGDAVSEDDMIRYEWARIPHFYMAFYVYQYATGYSAANAIADLILKGNEEDRDNYLEFLASGDCDYPVNLLKIAGVDMSSPEPVRSALNTFNLLVSEFCKLAKEK